MACDLLQTDEKTCPHCREPSSPGNAYCLRHHAWYMRHWRKSHTLTGEALRKYQVRRRARAHVKRGKIKRKPCAFCAEPKTEMHHDDYSKPFEVKWLCIPCHRMLHRYDHTPAKNQPLWTK